MKKKMARTLAVLMCLMTAVAFMPTFAFAAGQEGEAPSAVSETTEPADQNAAGAENETGTAAELGAQSTEGERGSGETTEPAGPIKVKMTVNDRGIIAKTDDGNAMADKEVTVEDINKDGVLSYDEALIGAHKAYCSGGYATSESQYGTTVDKLWGVSTKNTLFFTNNKALASSVGDTEVKDGDVLYASVNADNTNYADWYTYFNKKERTVETGEEFTLNLKGLQGMAGTSASNVKGVKVGVWKDGNFSQLGDTVTDDNGNAALSFEEAGTYLVTASGSVNDTWTDWEGKTISAACPIMAPVCFVTVEQAPEQEKTINVYLTINDKGKIAKDKDGKAMKARHISVKDLDGDGVYSYDEALATAHKEYAPNGEKDYSVSKDTVKKLWGNTSENFLFITDNTPIPTGVKSDSVSEGNYLLASINKDTFAYADWYTFFTEKEKSVKANESFNLTLKGYSVISAFDSEIKAEAVPEVKIGTVDEDGIFTQIRHKETDSTGRVSLSFSKAGTYYISAEGTVVTPAVKAWGLIDLSNQQNLYGTMDFDTFESAFAYTDEDYGEGPYPADEVKYIDFFEYDEMNAAEKAKYHILRTQDLINYKSPIMAPVCKVTVGGETSEVISQLKESLAILKAAAITPKAKASAGTNSVTLSWTVSEGADGYEVSANGGSWETAGGDSKTYKNLASASKYSYKVRGFVYLDGEGTQKYYSEESSVSVTTTPDKTSITSLKSKKRKITAKWSGVAGSPSYQIYFSTNSSFTKGLVKYSVSGKSKTSKKLKKGKKYYVKVRAYKDGVYGPWSAVKTVKCK